MITEAEIQAIKPLAETRLKAVPAASWSPSLGICHQIVVCQINFEPAHDTQLQLLVKALRHLR